MAKRISQNTFDDAVQQNEEDFDMGKEEALQSAISDFEAMGVDLSGILQTHPNSRVGSAVHPAVESIPRLHQFLLNPDGPIDLLKHLQIIRDCAKSDAKALIAENDGLDVLIRLIPVCNVPERQPHLLAVLRCLASVVVISRSAPLALHSAVADTRRRAGNLGELSLHLSDLVQQHENNAEASALVADATAPQVLPSVLDCMHSMIRHCEDNKQQFYSLGLLPRLVPLVSREADDKAVLKSLLKVLIAFFKDDDMTVASSSAFANARRFCESDDLHLTALSLLKNHCADETLLITLLKFLSCLSVSDEYCTKLGESGVVPLLEAVIASHLANILVLTTALACLKSLIRSDAIKKVVIEQSDLLSQFQLLITRYLNEVSIVSQILSILSGSVLRRPDFVQVVMDKGFGNSLVIVMSHYRQNPSVLRAGFLAIRNLVCRTNEFRDQFLGQGMESAIREALRTFPELLPAAFGALRDLGCDISGMSSGAKLVHLGVDGELLE